ncbi:MAG: type II toxin-antitoxin system PemK/MazF family toxin [Patescibacteria group bacterium]|jgi:mRNA-degrading endonuclease toxin of MazEF toxin-antitoxin module
MKKGEIWLIKLVEEKSVGHEYFNDRPALIIMANDIINSASVVTIMPLSSSGRYHWDDINIKKDLSNRLREDSIIKAHHIISYDKSRFIHKIGKADEKIIKQVESYLKKHFWGDQVQNL